MVRNDLRNIAIIAHVDHGKTTLVDQMLKQSGTFRQNQAVEERVMDSDAIEKERGITILAKNASIRYKDTKINIIDTPGHADFGGEVERVLKMVDGVLLLVDAAEGPMPQTRFTAQRAISMGLDIIIVVNKVDRPDARLKEVQDETLELLMELNASDSQLESPFIYCSGKDGTASLNASNKSRDLTALFDLILRHFKPFEKKEGELQLLVSSVDYNDYVGRMGIGRIERGEINAYQDVAVVNYSHKEKPPKRAKIVNLYQIEGLERQAAEKAFAGDIVCFSGIDQINIGDTIASTINPESLSFPPITQPTVEMTFSVNDSPFAGKEGKFVTSRHLRERLFRETLKDVSLKVYDTSSAESFNVCGRGEMHLSILIENMRRDGYEFQVSTPRVLFKQIDGIKCEPFERLLADVPESSSGAIFQAMGERKGELCKMTTFGNRLRLEFIVPSRALFGYKNEFMTATKGEGVLNLIFHDYMAFKGEISGRSFGSLVAFESGEAVTYGIHSAQARGVMFIEPSDKVYEGMVVGMSAKAGDISVNVCKKKHITNMRASGSDDALRLNGAKKMSMEECLEFLADDELLEVTPKTLRIRKRILDTGKRLKQGSKN